MSPTLPSVGTEPPPIVSVEVVSVVLVDRASSAHAVARRRSYRPVFPPDVWLSTGAGRLPRSGDRRALERYVPAVTRTDPDLHGDELTLLTQFLDFHRATLLQKVAGLTADQLRRRAVPTSEITLAGMLKHLALVEEVLR